MSKTRTQERRSPTETGKPRQHRFAIKLMRPIFQTAVITVRAGSDDEAVRLALRRAARLRDQNWVGSFEPRRYQYDVQHVIDINEWRAEAASEGDPNADVDVPAMLGPMENVRYLLLKADVEVGQGTALNQPWLDEKSYVFLADVAGDWLADIEALEEEGLAGYLRRGRRSNIIAFRRPVKDDDDGGPA